MSKLPRLNRWDAVLAAGLVAVVFVVGLLARTPLFPYVPHVVIGVVALLCISDWRDKGHSWFATLSWAIPLAGIWTGIHLFLGYPDGRVFLLGAASFLVMGISTRAASWWYRAVLRRPYKSKHRAGSPKS
jgi:hypothetical protein